MPIRKEYFDQRRFRHLHFSSNATVGEILRAYRHRKGQWWWLLTTEMEGTFFVCSFGSLLPYLTGRTPHIVHSIVVKKRFRKNEIRLTNGCYGRLRRRRSLTLRTTP